MEDMMKSRVREELEMFYGQRAERLKTLQLRDLLSTSPSILWTPSHKSAPEIVDSMIEKYLARFEDSWDKMLQDSEFCLKAMYLKSHITTSRLFYEEQLGNARARIVRELVTRYCMVEGTIDWSKLVAFNSGAD
jgi:hypothetical protein